MRSIKMYKLFYAYAEGSNKPLDFIEMANWWEYREKLDYEFDSLMTSNFVFDLIFFPIRIFQWRAYYRKSKNWDRVFEGLGLVTNT